MTVALGNTRPDSKRLVQVKFRTLSMGTENSSPNIHVIIPGVLLAEKYSAVVGEREFSWEVQAEVQSLNRRGASRLTG